MQAPASRSVHLPPRGSAHSTQATGHHLGQDVIAVPMEGEPLPIKGGNVGSTLQGTGSGARQVLALPAAGVADAAGQQSTGQGSMAPSLPSPSPGHWHSPLLTLVGDLLAWGIQVAMELAVALADGDTATASDVIIHSACQGQGPGVTLAASEGPGSCPRQGHYQAPPVLGMDPAPILESGCPAPTFRAKAAVHIVLLTQVADPQVGTGVHAGRAALQVHHVARTALGWKERRCELAQQAGRQGLPCSPGAPQAPGWPWCLPQKEAVLQLPGRPPAWEH